MKVNLIGTGAIYTAYNSACTLIDNKMIVDMPNGTLKQLLKQKINVEMINTIVITHMHGDHTADIPFFLEHIFIGLKSKNTIKIIGPVGIRKKVMELFNAYNFEGEEHFNKMFKVEFIEVVGEHLLIDNYDIVPYTVIHGEEKPALGYVINNTLGLTGDCGLCDGVEEIFKVADVIISDSSLCKGDKKHLGIDNLIYLNQKYNKKIICTHLRDNTREEIKKAKLKNIMVEDDFFELEINDVI